MRMQEDFSIYRNIAVLLLGGLGTRYDQREPKQFALFHGYPLFAYSAKALHDSPKIELVIFVVPEGYLERTEEVLRDIHFQNPYRLVIGGKTRQESSFRAIRYLVENKANLDAVVLIHDGARPNLTEELIEGNLAAVESTGAVVTAYQSHDSVAVSKDGVSVSAYASREEVYLLQTPQTFRLRVIYAAHERALSLDKEFTDDGSLVLETLSVHPLIVKGNRMNFKITTHADDALFKR